MTNEPTVQLLGPPQIVLGDRTITSFRSSRIVGLLGFLAVHPGRRSRDQVSEALWPNRSSESGRHNLRQTLVYVRQLIGPNAVIVDRSFLELNPELDVDAGIVLGLQDRSGDDRERLRRAAHAVAVYRGTFLEAADDDWLLEPRAQLSQLYVSALLQLADDALEHQPRRALELLNKAVIEEPLSDRARAKKIDALRRLGEDAAAQREFQAYKKFLLHELAIAPSPIVEEAVRARVGVSASSPKVDAELDDFSQAINSLVTGRRPQQAVELACSLTPYWVARGTGAQGRVLLETAIAKAGARLSPSAIETADLCLAELYVAQGDLNAGQRIIDRLLLSTRNELTKTRALLLSSRVASATFNPGRAEELLLEGRRLAIEHQFLDEEVDTYRQAPRIALTANDPCRAEALALEAVTALERLGEKQVIADALLTLAFAQHGNGNDETAMDSARRAIDVIGSLESPTATGVRTTVIRLLEELGESVEIEQGYRRGVDEAKKYENTFVVAVNLTYLGDYLTRMGRDEEAISIHSEALGIRRNLDERLGIATSLRGLGRAYLSLNRFPEAREALTESARLFLAAEAVPGHASSLLALAHVEAKCQNTGLAQRLIARSLHLLRGMTQLERSAMGPQGSHLLRDGESLESQLKAKA